MKYDENGALIQCELEGIKLLNRGKVRDIYDLGDSLLFVASDRLSAFDVVMPNGIPCKGEVLTRVSMFWFEMMDFVENHIISTDVTTRPELVKYTDDLQGRSMIVKKADPLAVECIVRGYIIGSGWKDYKNTGEVLRALKLRSGYQQAEKLDKVLFTPSTKAEQGLHDEAISFERTVEISRSGNG